MYTFAHLHIQSHLDHGEVCSPLLHPLPPPCTLECFRIATVAWSSILFSHAQSQGPAALFPPPLKSCGEVGWVANQHFLMHSVSFLGCFIWYIAFCALFEMLQMLLLFRTWERPVVIPNFQLFVWSLLDRLHPSPHPNIHYFISVHYSFLPQLF